MSLRHLPAGFLLVALLAPSVTTGAPTPAKIPRLGVIFPGGRGPGPAAFEKALPERGWIPGKNVLIEYRYARGDLGAIPRLVAELVALDVSVIVSSSQAISL